MIVADTDVLIDALRGREPSAARVRAGLRDGTLVTTSVNAFELLSGARSPREADAVDRLLGAMTILPLDATAAGRAASCRRDLEAAGQTIGMGDSLIVGICLSRTTGLLTRNRRHLDRVTDLVVIDP